MKRWIIKCSRTGRYHAGSQKWTDCQRRAVLYLSMTNADLARDNLPGTKDLRIVRLVRKNEREAAPEPVKSASVDAYVAELREERDDLKAALGNLLERALKAEKDRDDLAFELEVTRAVVDAVRAHPVNWALESYAIYDALYDYDIICRDIR